MSFPFPLNQWSNKSVSEARNHGVAFNKVLAVVTGDLSDEGVLAHGSDLVKPVRGRLHVLYVIEVDRSLPVDAEIGPAAAKAEDILRKVEEMLHLPRSEFDANMVQSRELGPAVVSEALSLEVDAIVIGTSLKPTYGSFSLSHDIRYVLEHAPCLVVMRREPPVNQSEKRIAERTGVGNSTPHYR